MILQLELIMGCCAGVEYAEDDEFHYILVEVLFARFSFCWEKRKSE